MALFLQLYFSVPVVDLKKTTLADGNPHRFDHILLGAVLIQGSLYKAPKDPVVTQLWLWDDPEFDPFDPQPSERLICKSIYNNIAQELERVKSDKQITFPAHYIIGNQLQRQLGFFYVKARDLLVAEEEMLFHVILGAIPLELSMVAAAKQEQAKTLKPVYLNNLTKQLQIPPFATQRQISQAFTHEDLSKLEDFATSDISNLLQIYYHLNQS